MDSIRSALQRLLGQDKTLSPLAYGVTNVTDQESDQAQQKEVNRIVGEVKKRKPNTGVSDRYIRVMAAKYGDKLIPSDGDVAMPSPTPTQAHPIRDALQHVLGVKTQAQASQQQLPTAAPTPADSQFPNKLDNTGELAGQEYNPVIEKAANEYGVPAALLKAVLARESMQFTPKYVGGYHTDGTGRGIAGIDKKWHPEVTDEQAFDPNYAIPYAAKLLSGYKKQQGDWGKALRYYNGGGNFDSDAPGFQGVPIKQRTMDYMNNVYKQAMTYSGKN